MAKHKLARFAENREFPNMFQPRWEELLQGFPWKGNWKDFFGNNNPIILELGCGKGDYTVYQAALNPGGNFIGVDIKGARMWRGCKTSQEKGMQNVAFIRTYVQMLPYFFKEGEVSAIWITFPDPQPRKSRERRRLTAPRFIELYSKLLVAGGPVHLKTDNRPLFDYTLEVINKENKQLLYASHDVYQAPDAPAIATGVQTFYEQMFLAEGKPICYLTFIAS